MLLRGTLYADDAGVVSQSPEQLGKMIGVIVVVCAAIGLPVSEAKIKIMHLRKKGMPGSSAIFRVEAAGQVYSQTNEFLYLGENVYKICPSRSTGAYAMHGVAPGSTPSNYTTHGALPSSSKPGCLEPRYSRQCCTTASCGTRARATTTRFAEPTTVS